LEIWKTHREQRAKGLRGGKELLFKK
jgi:hypothetical protein